MSKASRLWAISVALLAIGATLGLRLHKSSAKSAPAVTSLGVPSVSTEFVVPSKQKPVVTDNVVQSGSPPASISSEPLPPAQRSDGEQLVFDRDFVIAAAKPYVEAYQRKHSALHAHTFAWGHARVVFVPAPEGSVDRGYLGVFFPGDESFGVGFACFKVKENADHLEPLVWGYDPNSADAEKNFREGPVGSDSCLHIL